MENVEKILEISGGDSDSCRGRSIYASGANGCYSQCSFDLVKQKITYVGSKGPLHLKAYRSKISFVVQ